MKQRDVKSENDSVVITLPVLLTIPMAAKILLISRSSVYALISQGKIPGTMHVGGQVRIHREILLRWITDECQRKGA